MSVALLFAAHGARLPRTFVILSASASLRPRSETARSATEALELVRTHMTLRHPGLTIETGDGEELSFFQLKDLAQSESREQNARTIKQRAPNVTRS